MSELRPSFGERDTYLNLLSAAYADGRIDDEEFDKRTQGVLSAVTHKDAIAQFEGLPAMCSPQQILAQMEDGTLSQLSDWIDVGQIATDS